MSIMKFFLWFAKYFEARRIRKRIVEIDLEIEAHTYCFSPGHGKATMRRNSDHMAQMRLLGSEKQSLVQRLGELECKTAISPS
jgi:hypothetical protein